MIKLNTNYDGLLEELERLEKHFFKRGNYNKSFASVQVYKILQYMYFLSTEKKAKSFKISKNDPILEIASQKEKQFYHNYLNNFFKNKLYHANMFSTVYFECMDILEDFYDSDYFEKLISTYKSPFDSANGEDLDVLLNFFNEIDPSAKDAYLDLIKQNKIYELNPFFNRDALTIFNPIEKSADIFIRKRTPFVEYLASHAHEMGHVMDDLDFMNRFSDNSHWKNIAQTTYTEVLSTLYQQKFYEFLVENNIKKDEAVLCAIDNYYNYLMDVSDGLLYSLLSDSDHMIVTSDVYTRNQVVNMIIDNEIDGLATDDVITSFEDSIEYGYGLIVSNCIMNDEEMFKKFLNIRKGLFDSSELGNIGITPEVAQKKLVKNIEWFINK